VESENLEARKAIITGHLNDPRFVETCLPRPPDSDQNTSGNAETKVNNSETVFFVDKPPSPQIAASVSEQSSSIGANLPLVSEAAQLNQLLEQVNQSLIDFASSIRPYSINNSAMASTTTLGTATPDPVLKSISKNISNQLQSTSLQITQVQELLRNSNLIDVSRGRPLGSGNFESRDAFLDTVRSAANQIRRRGNKVTQKLVAEALYDKGLVGPANPEFQLRRWAKEFNFLNWQDLRTNI
jgi:hypothetical protein